MVTTDQSVTPQRQLYPTWVTGLDDAGAAAAAAFRSYVPRYLGEWPEVFLADPTPLGDTDLSRTVAAGREAVANLGKVGNCRDLQGFSILADTVQYWLVGRATPQIWHQVGEVAGCVAAMNAALSRQDLVSVLLLPPEPGTDHLQLAASPAATIEDVPLHRIVWLGRENADHFSWPSPDFGAKVAGQFLCCCSCPPFWERLQAELFSAQYHDSTALFTFGIEWVAAQEQALGDALVMALLGELQEALLGEAAQDSPLPPGRPPAELGELANQGAKSIPRLRASLERLREQLERARMGNLLSEHAPPPPDGPPSLPSMVLPSLPMPPDHSRSALDDLRERLLVAKQVHRMTRRVARPTKAFGKFVVAAMWLERRDDHEGITDQFCDEFFSRLYQRFESEVEAGTGTDEVGEALKQLLEAHRQSLVPMAVAPRSGALRKGLARMLAKADSMSRTEHANALVEAQLAELRALQQAIGEWEKQSVDWQASQQRQRQERHAYGAKLRQLAQNWESWIGEMETFGQEAGGPPRRSGQSVGLLCQNTLNVRQIGRVHDAFGTIAKYLRELCPVSAGLTASSERLVVSRAVQEVLGAESAAEAAAQFLRSLALPEFAEDDITLDQGKIVQTFCQACAAFAASRLGMAPGDLGAGLRERVLGTLTATALQDSVPWGPALHNAATATASRVLFVSTHHEEPRALLAGAQELTTHPGEVVDLPLENGRATQEPYAIFLQLERREGVKVVAPDEAPTMPSGE